MKKTNQSVGHVHNETTSIAAKFDVNVLTKISIASIVALIDFAGVIVTSVSAKW